MTISAPKQQPNLKACIDRCATTELIDILEKDIQVRIFKYDDFFSVKGFEGNASVEALSKKVIKTAQGTMIPGPFGLSIGFSSTYEEKQRLKELLILKIFNPLIIQINRLDRVDRVFYMSMNLHERIRRFPVGGYRGFGIISHAECLLPLTKDGFEADNATQEIKIIGKALSSGVLLEFKGVIF